MVTRAKILKVVEPATKGYWDCYVVTLLFEGSNQPIVSYKNRDEYKKFELEQMLLDKGVDGKLLEEYKDACFAICERNHAEDEAGESL